MRRSPPLISLVALLVLGGLYLASRNGTREADGGEGFGVPPGVAPESAGRDTPALAAAARSPAESSTGSKTTRAPVLLETEASATSTDGTASRGELLVVEADGHTPRPGFAVRFVLCDANDAGAEPERLVRWGGAFETDVEGRAEVAASLARAPQAEFARFFSSRDERFELLPSELRIAELSADASAPTVLRLLPRETAPVRALAVDASTREPLQNFALRVQRLIDMPDAVRPVSSVGTIGYFVATRFWDATNCEWMITDATGHFTTERAYPSGRLGFLTIDQERADLQHDGQHDDRDGAQALLLEVPVGPLVRLAFTPGGSRSAEDYVAGLWRAPEELVSTEGVQEFPSPWSADRGRRAGYWGNALPVQVGEDGGAYVRLGLDQAREPLPSFLFLLSRDGASFGFAALGAFARYRDEPLVVALDERLALGCVLVWPEGAGAGADLDVQLLPRSDPEGRVRELSVDRVRGEERTAFRFQALAPGDYSLRISAGELQEHELDIGLPRFDTIEIHPRLAEPEELHEVVIRIVSDSGTPLDGEAGRARLGRLFLMPVGAPGRSLLTGQVVWSEGAATVRLTGVPSGTYRRQVSWTRGAHRIEPLEKLIEVPGPVPILLVRDTSPTIRAEVRVLNPPVEGALVVSAYATHGMRLNELVQFEPGDARELLPDGRTFLTLRTGPIDARARLRARLDSEEHRTVILEDEAFSAPNREGVRELEILSQPGFSVRIWVWTAPEGEDGERVQLSDIVLTLDGLEQDPTNASGVLDVSLDETPLRIGVSTPGWRLVTRTSWDHWGSVFAETGEFTIESGYLDVILESTDD